MVSTTRTRPDPEPLCYTPREAALVLSVSRTKIYELMAAGLSMVLVTQTGAQGVRSGEDLDAAAAEVAASDGADTGDADIKNTDIENTDSKNLELDWSLLR